jgi:hypothetical protein
LPLNSKTRAYIGFAIKMGKIVYGLDGIEAKRGAPALILISGDASERTVRNIKTYAEKRTVTVLTTDEPPTGNPSCKVCGIYDSSLAKAIIAAEEGTEHKLMEGI